jgi:hypothetical protein
VDQIEVDVAEVEARQGLLRPRDGVVMGLGVRRQLRGEEDLLAGDAGVPDGAADAGLVAVSVGGVDVPVAHLEGGPDRVVGGVPVGNLPGAEAYLGDRGSGGQREGVGQYAHPGSPSLTSVCTLRRR